MKRKERTRKLFNGNWVIETKRKFFKYFWWEKISIEFESKESADYFRENFK